MYSHHDSISLGNLKHLVADHDAGEGLADVLHHLAAVDPVGDHGSALLRVVDVLGLALLVLMYPQVRVFQVQAVGQPDTPAPFDFEDAVAPKLSVLVGQDRVQNLPRLLPQLGDHGVGAAVGVDHSLGLVQLQCNTKVPKLGLELLGTHPIPCAQDCGLAHEPLVLGDRSDGLAVDGRGHYSVHVFPVVEGSHQIILPSKPCQRTGFNLGGVRVDHVVALGGQDCILK